MRWELVLDETVARVAEGAGSTAERRQRRGLPAGKPPAPPTAPTATRPDHRSGHATHQGGHVPQPQLQRQHVTDQHCPPHRHPAAPLPGCDVPTAWKPSDPVGNRPARHRSASGLALRPPEPKPPKFASLPTRPLESNVTRSLRIECLRADMPL